VKSKLKVQRNREEVTREWRKLPNEELHNSCSALNILKAIKSIKMRWE
jgi:hypothetical protein